MVGVLVVLLTVRLGLALIRELKNVVTPVGTSVLTNLAPLVTSEPTAVGPEVLVWTSNNMAPLLPGPSWVMD